MPLARHWPCAVGATAKQKFGTLIMFTVPRPIPGGALRPPTILLVEDEAIIRLSLAEHLRECGFDVLEAWNGDLAKDLLGERGIDVVFTDVQMPGQLDGLALARWLRETYPDVDLMITSGVVEMTDRARELCDAASVFAKPYDHDAVTARIRTLVN
jgi:DNA-binding response OmpR family regulator